MAKLATKPTLVDQLRDEIAWLQHQPMNKVLAYYDELIHYQNDPETTKTVLSEFGKGDRFFLLTHLLGRVDAIHPWIYDRCREVELAPDDHLDLWARGHYKSTIITFAGSIQEIVKDPEISIGIFSHTRPIAKAFLRQVKREFEQNDLLKQTYPEALWAYPKRESPLWSEESGIIVRREGNQKEATIEAWGLVDGQPISKHFTLRIYDDVVTRESVNTGDQILKTTECYELSLSLSSRPPRQQLVGTRYSFADTYKTIMDSGKVKARVYPATEDGSPDGKPVFFSQKELDSKRADPYIFACQYLQNPVAGSEQDLKPEWIRTWEVRPLTLNVYIMADPADSKERGTSNTAMAVVGLDANHNKYLLDGMCHKMNLKERWQNLKKLRSYWLKEPGIQSVFVGYEKYGMQADIQHYQEMMEIEGEHFDIQELSWTRDGTQTKDDRIRRLVPDLSNWKFFFPYDGDVTKRQRQAMESGQNYLCSKAIKRINHEKKVYDLVKWVLSNEYLMFPATTHKDFLDVLSRFYDMDPVVPMVFNQADTMPVAED